MRATILILAIFVAAASATWTIFPPAVGRFSCPQMQVQTYYNGTQNADAEAHFAFSPEMVIDGKLNQVLYQEISQNGNIVSQTWLDWDDHEVSGGPSGVV